MNGGYNGILPLFIFFGKRISAEQKTSVVVFIYKKQKVIIMTHNNALSS